MTDNYDTETAALLPPPTENVVQGTAIKIHEYIERYLARCRPAVAAKLRADGAWKEAIIDASVVNWTLSAENENDPRKAVADLLAVARRESLDPKISEPAAKLHERIAALEQENKLLRGGAELGPIIGAQTIVEQEMRIAALEAELAGFQTEECQVEECGVQRVDKEAFTCTNCYQAAKQRIAALEAERDACRTQIDKISHHPTVAARAGVGDGAVGDAVIAVCGALESAEAERDRLAVRVAFLTNGEAERQMAAALGLPDDGRVWTLVGLQDVAREVVKEARRLAERVRRLEEGLNDIAHGYNLSSAVNQAIDSGNKLTFQVEFASWMQQRARAALAEEGDNG